MAFFGVSTLVRHKAVEAEVEQGLDIPNHLPSVTEVDNLAVAEEVWRGAMGLSVQTAGELSQRAFSCPAMPSRLEPAKPEVQCTPRRRCRRVELLGDLHARGVCRALTQLQVRKFSRKGKEFEIQPSATARSF